MAEAVSDCTNTNAMNGDARPVTELSPMELATVIVLDASQEDVTRLKQLGICSGRRIQLVKAGDPLILRVLGSRIGLSRRLAQFVIVQSCNTICD